MGFDKLDEDTGSDPPVACVTAVQSCSDQPTVPPHWPDMQQAQTADPVISVILQRVATRVRPPYEAIQRTGHQIKAFWHKYDELFFMMDFCSDIRVTIVRRYNWWCPQSLFLLSFGNYIPVSLLAILG